jgi:hypothetical protein
MPKIIVGFSSTPPRVNSIVETVLSLKNQMLKPDEIVLSIPKVSARFGVPYDITNPELLALIADGTLIINEIDHDYGPATKFVGLLYSNYNPDDLLVWLDDDVKYGPRVLKCLSKRIRPNNAISFSGFNFAKNGSLAKTNFSKIKPHEKFDVVEGFATIATYQKNMPGLQDLEVYNIRPQTTQSLKTISKKERLEFMSDDFTISQYFKKNNIERNIVAEGSCHKDKANNIKPLNLGFKDDALHKQKTDQTSKNTNHYNYKYLLNYGKNSDEQNKSNGNVSQCDVSCTSLADRWQSHSNSQNQSTRIVFGSILLFFLAMCSVFLLITHKQNSL